MQPICSVTVCSQRPKGLINCLKSLHDGADKDQFEVIVRLEASRSDTFHVIQDALSFGNVRVLISHYLNGYLSLDEKHTEIMTLAKGKWISIIDDDMTIEGGRWADKLGKIEGDYFVTCEKYRLGPSGYGRGSCRGTGWFLPRDFLKKYGLTKIENPPDTWAYELLVNQHKWPLAYLDGITLNHQWRRPSEERGVFMPYPDEKKDKGTNSSCC